MSLDGAGLRVLSRSECLVLLGTVTVGRVAVSHRALPMILPVHFRVTAEELVVIRTMPGTILHRATDQTVVAFEAEGPAGSPDPSWSVIVHGVATHARSSYGNVSSDEAAIAIPIDRVTGYGLFAIIDPMVPTATMPRW